MILLARFQFDQTTVHADELYSLETIPKKVSILNMIPNEQNNSPCGASGINVFVCELICTDVRSAKRVHSLLAYYTDTDRTFNYWKSSYYELRHWATKYIYYRL